MANGYDSTCVGSKHTHRESNFKPKCKMRTSINDYSKCQMASILPLTHVRISDVFVCRDETKEKLTKQFEIFQVVFDRHEKNKHFNFRCRRRFQFVPKYVHKLRFGN